MHRHTLNVKGAVTQQGVKLAMAVAHATHNQNASGSVITPLSRTEETRKAFAQGADFSVPRDTTVIEFLGNQAWVDVIYAAAKSRDFDWAGYGRQYGYLAALKEVIAPSVYDFLKEFIKTSFQLMINDDRFGVYVLVFAHSPFIELLADAFGCELPAIFPEMSYVDFLLYDDGQVEIDYWICDHSQFIQ